MAGQIQHATRQSANRQPRQFIYRTVDSRDSCAPVTHPMRRCTDIPPASNAPPALSPRRSIEATIHIVSSPATRALAAPVIAADLYRREAIITLTIDIRV